MAAERDGLRCRVIVREGSRVDHILTMTGLRDRLMTLADDETDGEAAE